MPQSIYGYWGCNRSVYSNSNIHFTGDAHDFILHAAKAKDRASSLAKEYFDITRLTIPQYNFRIDVTLMGGKRHDEFHLAGYGISARIGFRLYIMKYFFFMIDAKGGMIHFTDIKTSYNYGYKATQKFFFGEHYGADGIIISLKNAK